MKTIGKKVQITAYVPHDKLDRNYPERLASLAAKKERSISFLIIAAIDQYLRGEERLQ